MKGAFDIKLVKIGDFENPSNNLETQSFIVKSDSMDSLYVEEGHSSLK